jgi:phosphoesterase RecJ-like protein
MIDAADHARFRQAYEGATTFVLVTHVQPDGDALGSEIGLAHFLLAHGKRVRIVNQDPTPELLRFLETDRCAIEVYDADVHDAPLRGTDLLVLVDNSAPDRLGRMERIMGECASRTLCIDHHPARDTPWSRQVLDERSCATAAMIYRLVRGAGWTPDGAAAEALYVGLATDTGFFRFNSTDVEAHEIAAELLRLGAVPAKVFQAIYERNSLAYTRMLGHALTGVRVLRGAVAFVAITRELVERLDAVDVDASEITTTLLAMDGIRVALMFRELDRGRVKVSLRSKGAIDVHCLAGEFGGGGHRNASGIVTDGILDDVVRVVTERAATLV